MLLTGQVLIFMEMEGRSDLHCFSFQKKDADNACLFM